MGQIISGWVKSSMARKKDCRKYYPLSRAFDGTQTLFLQIRWEKKV